jgi:hypothetical protein
VRAFVVATIDRARASSESRRAPRRTPRPWPSSCGSAISSIRSPWPRPSIGRSTSSWAWRRPRGPRASPRPPRPIPRSSSRPRRTRARARRHGEGEEKPPRTGTRVFRDAPPAPPAHGVRSGGVGDRGSVQPAAPRPRVEPTPPKVQEHSTRVPDGPHAGAMSVAPHDGHLAATRNPGRCAGQNTSASKPNPSRRCRLKISCAIRRRNALKPH